MKQKSKSALLADNTRGLITKKKKKKPRQGVKLLRIDLIPRYIRCAPAPERLGVWLAAAKECLPLDTEAVDRRLRNIDEREGDVSTGVRG